MLKIVVCCGAGMSSSYLCNRLQMEAENRKLAQEVSFDYYSLDVGRLNAADVLKNYDVALCCPHLSFFVKEFCKNNPNLSCAVYIMPPKLYGTLPFDEIYQDAQDVYRVFLKEHKNPFYFDGEEINPLKIERSISYRKWKQKRKN